MTDTMQSPMTRTGRGASRVFALRHRDSVGIGIEGRAFVKASDS